VILKNGVWVNRTLLALVVMALVAGFTPISRHLLQYVGGSFAPTPYSSLALSTPSAVTTGIATGSTIPVELTNHTGRATTYHWTATQGDVVISRGSQTLSSDGSTVIYVATEGAVVGSLRIALNHTKTFLTVPIISPGS